VAKEGHSVSFFEPYLEYESGAAFANKRGLAE
jgi:hypothetical protein